MIKYKNSKRKRHQQQRVLQQNKLRTIPKEHELCQGRYQQPELSSIFALYLCMVGTLPTNHPQNCDKEQPFCV